jgi:chemotaxis protein MotB
MPSAVMSCMTTRALSLLAILALVGCVTLVDHRAEVARVRALEHDRELTGAQLDEITLQVRHLERAGQNLEIEREALDEERMAILRELEQMRVGNLSIQEDLVREREIRLSRDAEIAELTGTYHNLVEQLESEIESGQIEIHQLRGRLQVRALDQILFDSGRTVIKPQGRKVLARVGQEIAKLKGHRVRVEGHTDSVPISTKRFASNWELSAARAVRVVRFLIEQGLDAEKLSAEALGPYEPIDTNDTPKGRARNRRIEIVLVPEG